MNENTPPDSEPRRIELDAWHAEGRARYGDNATLWKFKCPSCGFEQSAQDMADAGVTPKRVDTVLGFSCIGRQLGSNDPSADVVDFGVPHRGAGCNYAGGGLFRINPVHVLFGKFKEDGTEAVRETFEWADPAPKS